MSKHLDEDPIVAKVMQRMHDRSIEGMKKFGVSMLRQDTTTVEWIDNAIEELLDAAVYLERIKIDLLRLRTYLNDNIFRLL